SVAPFGMESVERWMAEAVAANEVDNQKHQQRAANHDRHSDFQPELHVVKIGDFPNHVRTESAEQLRGEHVNTDASGVRSARHHVMKNGSDGAVVPGHKKARDEKAGQH